MVNENIQAFLAGVLVTTATVIGTRFFTFWRRTEDRLFLYFGLAFLVLALNWLLLTFFKREEHQTGLYALRLVAFGLIAAGVWGKNAVQRWAPPHKNDRARDSC